MPNYDLKLSQKIYDYYIESNMGFNETCKACKSFAKSKGHTLTDGPVPIFHVGSQFSSSPTRIMYVGMVAYGWTGDIGDWFMVDNKKVRTRNKQKTIEHVEWRIDELFYNKRVGEKKMKLFTFMRESSKAIFGADNFKKIAISNLVHCNENKTANKLPSKVFNYCVLGDNTKYILKEIEILNPTHVVLFSTDDKFTRFCKDIEALGPKTMTSKHPSRANLNKFIEDLKIFVKD